MMVALISDGSFVDAFKGLLTSTTFVALHRKLSSLQEMGLRGLGAWFPRFDNTPFRSYASKHGPRRNLRLLLIKIGSCIEPKDDYMRVYLKEATARDIAGRGAATCAGQGSCEHGGRSTPLPLSLSFGSVDGDLNWPSALSAADSAVVCTHRFQTAHTLCCDSQDV